MRIDLPNLPAIENIVFETAIKRFGPLARGTKKLAGAIRDLSDYYIANPDIRGKCPGSPAHQAARMVFFNLADMPKAFVLTAELDTLVGINRDRKIKILDVGVGYGSQSLGLLSYLFRNNPNQHIRLDAVDQDGHALEAFDQLLMNCQTNNLIGNVAANIWQFDLEQGFRPREEYDFIIVGNTLCELPQSSQYLLAGKLLSRLAESGAMFIIEPALKATSRNLHRLRDKLLENRLGEIVAPCTRSEGCPCLMHADDWCHEARHYLLPPRCRQLSTATGLRMYELKWSYLTFTHQEIPSGGKYAGAWRVVSDLLKHKGKHEVFLCGTPGRLRTILQKRDRTSTNQPFKKLHRGQFVRIQGAEVVNDYFMLNKGSSVVVEDPVTSVLTC